MRSCAQMVWALDYEVVKTTAQCKRCRPEKGIFEDPGGRNSCLKGKDSDKEDVGCKVVH